MERLMSVAPASTHDLIRLREPIALAVDTPAPDWVMPVLKQIPWVVVRRGPIRDGLIPVGVRPDAIATVRRRCDGLRVHQPPLSRRFGCTRPGHRAETKRDYPSPGCVRPHCAS